jgi:hypothetical protein
VIAAAEVSGAVIFAFGFASSGLLVRRHVEAREVARDSGRTALAGG